MDIFQAIVDLWLKQIKNAEQEKYRVFGKTAERAWGFLGKPFVELYQDLYDFSNPEVRPFPHSGPYFPPRRNLSREFCNVYLPYLHHRVPNRKVEPRRPQPPADLIAALQGAVMQNQGMANPLENVNERIGAWLLQWVLNYLPTEYGLHGEVRPVLQEALVKGRGVYVHEISPGPTGMIPSTLGDSVDNWSIDPDAVKVREAGWMCQLVRTSAWRLAETFQIPVKELRGQNHSYWNEANNTLKRQMGDLENKPDVCAYYIIYTRGAGLGQKFEQSGRELEELGNLNEYENSWLVIMPGVPYPLNLAPWVREQGPDAIKKSLQWPVPFYADPASPWPVTHQDFYPNGDNPYATSTLEAALPLQTFIDHAYAFVFNRIRATCRDILLVDKLADLKLINALHWGLDQEMVLQCTGEGGPELDKLIHILQFPPANKDLWSVISLAERAFERMTGMDPLLYGAQPGPTQIRSSAEAQIRQQGVSSRPNDFADAVEDCNSRITAKEGFMSRLYIREDIVSKLFADSPPIPTQQVPQDMEVSPGFLTQKWMEILATDDPYEAAADYMYSIEAGSGRRKNIQKAVQDAQQLVQTLMPDYRAIAMAGAPRKFNELVQILGEAMEVDLTRLMLDPQDMAAIAAMQQSKAGAGGQAEGEVPE